MNKFAIGCTLLVAFSISTMSVWGQDSTPELDKKYQEYWNKIDSLEKDGLTTSALQLVEEIQAASKVDQLIDQEVKGLIYSLKYHSIIEEESDAQNIWRLREAIIQSKAPVKNILLSILAQSYWSYYENNRWRLYNRTETEIRPEDFKTWDAATFMREVSQLYIQSLAESDVLKKIPAASLHELLKKGNHPQAVRPSLYDLLAHRFLDYLSNTESLLNEPIGKFELPARKGLLDAAQFVKEPFETTDSLSLVFQAIKLYQELLSFHLNASEPIPAAIIDLDLKRLAFSYEHSIGILKRELYLKGLDNLSRKYSAEPATAKVFYKLASMYFSEGEKYEPLVSEAFRWEKKKARDICLEAIRIYPSSYGASLCQNLLTNIESKALSFQLENVNLPEKPFRAALSFKHLDHIYFRIIEEPLWIKEELNREEYIAKLLEEQALKSWSLELPDEGDFQQHTTEIRIPDLDAASYLLLASDSKDFSVASHALSVSPLKVSSLSGAYRLSDDQQNIEIRVVDRTTGKALSGVDVQLHSYDYRERNKPIVGPKGLTDKNGTITFSRKGLNDQLTYTLKRKNDELVSERLYLYSGGIYNSIDESRIITNFFTDRKIYRPGQTIYLKAIVLEKNERSTSIKENHPLTISFFDVNGELIEEKEARTNEFGTISTSFIAPKGKLLGRMRIDGEGGATSILVEEYKRPSFEIILKQADVAYQLNDTVSITGELKAYAGMQLSSAEIKYRVVREAQFPYWSLGYRRGPFIPVESQEIAFGSLVADENGGFEIAFELIPDQSIPQDQKPIFSYRLEVDGTNKFTGETHSAQQITRAGYVSVAIDIKLPEVLDRTEPGAAKISCENLSGGKASAKGALTVYSLEPPLRLLRKRRWEQADIQLMSREEYLQNFPYDIYQDENERDNWKTKKAVFRRSLDLSDDQDLPLAFLSDQPEGMYKIVLTAEDGNIEISKYFSLMDPDQSKPVVPTALELGLSQAQAEPGEKISVKLMTSEKKAYAFWELVQDDKVLKSGWAKLKNKKATTLEFPILESYRGNVYFRASMVLHNEWTLISKQIRVPWSNKQLTLEWGSFRSELQPGEKDQWTVKISGPQGAKASAEMVAAMYDASLDVFAANAYHLYLYPSYGAGYSWNVGNGYDQHYSTLYADSWNPRSVYIKPYSYNELNLFDYLPTYNGNIRQYALRSEAYAASPAPMMEAAEEMSVVADGAAVPQMRSKNSANAPLDSMEELNRDGREGQIASPQIRRNFNETAFFFPQLKTNEAGEILINFTLPEALTRWKFIGLAHTKDLKVGTLGGEVVSRKKLMVQANFPRFVRSGDSMTFTAMVSNLDDKDQIGVAELHLLDAFTMEPLDESYEFRGAKQAFQVKKAKNTGLSWEYKIPEGLQGIIARVIVRSDDFSDGEEHMIPVLENRMLVTESLPLAVKAKEEKRFSFDKLLAAGSSETLQHESLTLEITSNPVWYAVQALPYLMEYPYSCTEQIFSRYYANAMASHIANSQESIKQVFEQWASFGEGDEGSFLSQLERNQELKTLLLEETPWLLNARDEKERKQRIALLFDLNKMSDELNMAFGQLRERQYASGGFSWFPGMPESRYITQLIATGLGHMKQLGINMAQGDAETAEIVATAIPFLDRALLKDYEWLKKRSRKMSDDHLGPGQIQYLYMRSFYDDIPITEGTEEAYAYYLGQAEKYALKKSIYMKGMLALSFHRLENEKMANRLIRSLSENAVRNEELGMYWKANQGWYWYEAEIERQALMIEAFSEIGGYEDEVENLQLWLLKHKQTNDWKTTRATVAACNALLMIGNQSLESKNIVTASVGDEQIDPLKRSDIRLEAGAGYYKTSWEASEIKESMGEISITNPGDNIAWGAVYWQYFEEMDKITRADNPLSIEKTVYLNSNTGRGPKLTAISEEKPIRQGDKLVVKIELRVDRDMEYVHLKDMRAAGFEPEKALSGYEYQGGLGYYRSTKDASTNFFIERLPKGTHVFEYQLRATHAGNFSNGIASLQCMYAPEFTSHTDGIRLTIEGDEKEE